MKEFKKGDTLVVKYSFDHEYKISLVGKVISVEEDGFYTLDCLPNVKFRADCLRSAKGADLICQERRRQIEVKGYNAYHDFREPLNHLVAGGISYAICDIDEECASAWWPWELDQWKPKDRMRNLIRAGALIAAAIDKMLDEEDFEKNKHDRT